MIAHKHITKIAAAVMAAAVILCFLAMAFSDSLTELFGGTSVSMAYESALFDTDEIIKIDIQMDPEDWDDMLANATAEVYYECDVVINGTRISHVGIRPKGNTSLSTIAMDPTTNRFSFKLEFDQFVKGQTCFGLDKLVLNNNYADATNMKEAVIYDMFGYMDADASLYNYAEILVNGEYWGVYLALEAVEDSFMLRNFGTQDGELYKPDSMNMGDRNEEENGGGFPDFGGEGFPDLGEGDSPDFAGNGESADAGGNEGSADAGGNESSADAGGNEGSADAGGNESSADAGGNGEGASGPGQNTDSEGASAGSSGDNAGAANETPEEAETGEAEENVEAAEAAETAENEETVAAEENNGTAASDQEGESSGESAGGNFAGESTAANGENAAFNPAQMAERGDFNFPDMGGGPGMGGGSNLNYIDDDPDSYSTIWNCEVTKTGDADHRRVITALKNISEGNEPETYMDVDNLLRYMAVHTFSVNMDSLSGNMSHNYYLYEYEGRLNLFPWDYNLAFGSMSVGGSNGASGMINYPIDSPFSGTRFFNVLLENEEYLEKYHEYLRQLVEEYVFGGRFDEVYNRIRGQIDHLVETDPNALYTYDEYLAAAEMFYETVQLRATSIEGQLDGIVPSTSAAQRQDSSALIDSSKIDIDTMGTFGMGGNNGDSDGGSDGGSSGGRAGNEAAEEAPAAEAEAEEAAEEAAAAETPAAEASKEEAADTETAAEEAAAETPAAEASEEEAADTETEDTEAADTEAAAEEAAAEDMQAADTDGAGAPAGETPAAAEDTDVSGAGTEGMEAGEFPEMAERFGGRSGAFAEETDNNNLAMYGICFGILVVAVVGAVLVKRRG